MKGKILHIVSGDLWGGAEAQILLQTKALAALGWDVQVLFFNQKDSYQRYETAGIPCQLCVEDKGFFRWLRHAFRTVKLFSPDLLVAHGYKEGVLGFLCSISCRIPWIATFHGLTEYYSGFAKFKMGLYTFLYRLLVRSSAAKIVCVSKALQDDLGFAELKKLEIIYNVTDLNPLVEDKSELAAKVSSIPCLEHPAIVVVGRLAPVKRVDLAISAFDLAVSSFDLQANLYIIGDGPLRSSLEKLADSKPSRDRIRFCGFIAQAAQFIAQADLLVISSDSEGIPTVLLEAMVSNTPLVATNVGGISEVLERVPDYPAQLISAKDLNALAQAIAQSMSNSPDHLKIELIRKSIAEHFVPEVAAKKQHRIYSEVLGR